MLIYDNARSAPYTITKFLRNISVFAAACLVAASPAILG